MIDISAVFSAIVIFFGDALDWLMTHGIKIGSGQISFFALLVALLIIQTIICALVPWADDDGGDE